jgi:hypothetical protein
MALPAFAIVEITRQLFKFGGSFSKEATVAALTPAVISVYSAMQKACIESCTWQEAIFAPTGLQWATLLTTSMVLYVHLVNKVVTARSQEASNAQH